MTDMLTLIVNPIAGNGLAQKTHERARAFLSGRAIEFSSFVTRAPGEAEALCRSLAGKSGQAVAVLGGDGTLNEVVNGLAQSEITCLLVPCGTGNDFAKAMKLPKDPISALAAQLDAPDGYIDLGRMNDRIFANVSGIGFDVEVLRQTVRFKRLGRGILPYLCGVIAALFRFSPLHARVSLDGGLEAELRLTILSIGNGQYIGGGMKAVPDAVIDDGLFDAIAVEGIGKRSAPRMQERWDIVWSQMRGHSARFPSAIGGALALAVFAAGAKDFRAVSSCSTAKGAWCGWRADG